MTSAENWVKQNSPEALRASRTGVELLRLDEELDSLLSDSLELPELEPELDFTERLLLPLALTRAAATASLLRAWPRSSREGAGGLAAALTLIIPKTYELSGVPFQ